MDTREHTAANELEQQTIGSDELDHTYDRAGNMVTQVLLRGPGQKVTVTYTYDAWNRLVKAKYGTLDRSKYVYNGLNWRIVKHADTMLSAGVLNQKREMYYSANWQLLEERIDDDVFAQGEPGVDRRVEYAWGPRYIDDIIARRQYNYSNEDTDVWYHLTDAQFSTVAIINDYDAMIVERISYDAYGKARHHRAADLNGDGATTIDDRDLLMDNFGNYGVGDLDRNGVVNSTDLAILNANAGAALADGLLSSSSGTDNIIGYAGYVFDAESPGAANGYLYTVRYRHYEPGLGRWLERDPMGYVDGMGLYEYVRSRPLQCLDCWGLASDCEMPPDWGSRGNCYNDDNETGCAAAARLARAAKECARLQGKYTGRCTQECMDAFFGGKCGEWGHNNSDNSVNHARGYMSYCEQCSDDVVPSCKCLRAVTQKCDGVGRCKARATALCLFELANVFSRWRRCRQK